MVDSLPIADCDNIRIRRSKLYPQSKGAKASVATFRVNAATLTDSGYIWW